MESLATPDDVCTRLGVPTPEDDSPEYRRMETVLEDASAEIRGAIGRDVFDPVPHELRMWTARLAAGYLSAPSGTLGMTAGVSQHTTTLDGYTEGWADYSGGKAPGLSLPPDVAGRLRATYGNYSPVLEYRPGRFG